MRRGAGSTPGWSLEVSGESRTGDGMEGGGWVAGSDLGGDLGVCALVGFGECGVWGLGVGLRLGEEEGDSHRTRSMLAGTLDGTP